MTSQEFETLKTIIQESSWINDTNIDPDQLEDEPGMTLEEMQGQLKDGDSIIDLFIEWSNRGGNEDMFWSESKKILVDQ